MTDNNDNNDNNLFYRVEETQIGVEWALTSGQIPPSVFLEAWVGAEYEDPDAPLDPDEPDVTPEWVLEDGDPEEDWPRLNVTQEWEPISNLGAALREGADEDDRFALVADTDQGWHDDRSWLLVPEGRELTEPLVNIAVQWVASFREDDWGEDLVAARTEQGRWDLLHALVARDLTADQAVGILHSLFG